jgi:hypothetical protein
LSERDEIREARETYKVLCDVPAKDSYAGGVKLKPCGIKYKDKVVCSKNQTCIYYQEFHGDWAR